MRLGFFRRYEFVWRGSLRASSLSLKGPFPAKLIVGVRAPVDPETGMSVDLPLMDRKVADLLRLLSFSLGADEMPELLSLMQNMSRRLESNLKAESESGDDLQVIHFEIQVNGQIFKWRDGAYTSERRVRSQRNWPEGFFFVAHDKQAELRRALTASGSRAGSSDLDAVLQLAQLIEAPIRYRDWCSHQIVSVAKL